MVRREHIVEAFAEERKLPWKWAIGLCAVLWIAVMLGSYRYMTRPEVCESISKLPYDITTAGCYQVTEDLVFDEPASVAILVRSNNVTVDLDGHTVRAAMPLNGTSTGLQLLGGRGVVVENGTISGFLYGVRVEPRGEARQTEGFTLRNITLDSNKFRGAVIEGARSQVERVIVRDTGGTTFFPNASVRGLELAGPECIVVETSVLETRSEGTGESVGLALLEDADGCVLESNVIRNMNKYNGKSVAGIWTRSSYSNVTFKHNDVSGYDKEVLRY